MNDHIQHLRKTVEFYKARLNKVLDLLEPYKTLIDEKSHLENMIKGLENDLKNSEVTQLSFPEINPRGKPYEGMSTNDAMIAWLLESGKLHVIPEIAKGISKGGWTTNANIPYNVVYSAVYRELKKKSPRIYKQGDKYGAIKLENKNPDI